jgi:uncharacterized membrane protein YfcA
MTSSQITVSIINFLAAVLFGMLGVGAAPVFIATIQSLSYATVATVFPLAILLNGINSGFALIPFSRGKRVDWRHGGILSLVAGIFSFLGAYLAAYVPVRILLYALVIILAFLGLRTLTMASRPEPEKMPDSRKIALIGGPAAALAGFFGGLLAIGGGGILAPFLLMIGYEMRRASGTTALVATVASFAGFLGFVVHASIPVGFLIVSILFISVGSIVGALFAVKVAKPSWLRLTLGAVILASALRLLLRILNLA